MGWSLPVRALHSAKPLVGILLLLGTPPVYAMADMQTIMTNLAKVIPALTTMVLYISYVAGVVMIINGLMMMKKLGNFATQQTQPGEVSGPLMKILIGAALIYLPSSTDIISHSLFQDSNTLFNNGTQANYNNLGSGSSLLGYTGGDSLSQQWTAIANTLVLYIQFLGLLSFIKGWFIISSSAGHSSQPGTTSKGVTHIIGGIVAMNFVGAINVIYNTVFSS